MFKIYLISSLVLISLIACDDSLDNVWREWMKINKKSYGRNELTARFLLSHFKIIKLRDLFKKKDVLYGYELT